MTLTINLPRGFRHPSWYAPLLLPAVPALTFSAFDSRPFEESPVKWCWVLLAIGVSLALGLPWLLDRARYQLRKEVELVRIGWLVSVFAAQMPLLFGRDAMPIAILFFLASCALIAGLPFGAEFQQRTMAGLLSQPAGRGEIWRMKMLVLGAALVAHGMIFMVAAMATDQVMEFPVAICLCIAVAVAWGATPWWTLLTRSMLAGLAFSLAVPLVLASISSIVIPELWVDDVQLKMIWIGGPLYAAIGIIHGYHRWLRLEATDLPMDQAGGVFLSRRTAFSNAQRRVRSWRLLLLTKEFRLQTVTLATCALTLFLGVAVPFSHASFAVHEYLIGAVVLMGFTTVLLAGATSIAEERRLGTLDGQVLLPVSSRVQWWIKLVVGLGTTVVAATVVFLTLGASSFGHAEILPFEWADVAVILGMAIAAFAAAMLTSSTAGNTTRALVSAILLIAVSIGVGNLIASQATRWMGEVEADVEASVDSEPEAWLARARQVAPQWSQASESPSALSWGAAVASLLFLCVAAPTTLALFFSWRNFSVPAAARRKALGQAVACLAVIVAGGLAIAFTMRQLQAKMTRVQVLARAVDFVRWQDTLSNAERTLWDQLTRSSSSFPLDRTIMVPLRVAVPLDAADGSPGFLSVNPELPPRRGPAARNVVLFPAPSARLVRLPLSSADRGFLLQHAELAQPLREKLRDEAVLHHDATTNLPPEPVALPPGASVPAPGGNLQMNQELMRRYGLVPSGATLPEVYTGPVTNSPVQPPVKTGVPQSPGPQPMDPELMRRYGIAPPLSPAPGGSKPIETKPAGR